MKKKILTVLLLITFAILIGAQISFAKPQYFARLIEVYGTGSCGTCHVSASGGGSLNSYGTLFENQPNYASDPGAALKAIGAPPTANPTATAEVTMTVIATPIVTAITATATPMPPLVTATPATPGFGIVLSLIGLLSLFLLTKRNNNK